MAGHQYFENAKHLFFSVNLQPKCGYRFVFKKHWHLMKDMLLTRYKKLETVYFFKFLIVLFEFDYFNAFFKTFFINW